MSKRFEIALPDADIVFNLNSRFAVVADDSGTGKSYIATEMLSYSRAQFGSSDIDGPKVYSITHNGSSDFIDFYDSNALLIVDEELSNSEMDKIVKSVKSGSINAIFITRNKLGSLPYGLHDRYRLIWDESIKAFTLQEDILLLNTDLSDFTPNVILHEDRGFGLQAMTYVFGSNFCDVKSSGGKDNIKKKIRTCKLSDRILINLDMCGVDGSIVTLLQRIYRYGYPNVRFTDRPSLEWMLCRAPMLKEFIDINSNSVYSSEEEKWFSLFRDTVSKVFDIQYDKQENSNLLHLIFSEGTDWFYPEINR